MPRPFEGIPPETLEISPYFAPDGSYPARLLFVNSSVWLPEGAKRELLPGIFAVCEQGRYYLLQDIYEAKKGVLINGQPHLDRVELRDGDFIQIKKHKAVFQADPAGDKRKAREAEYDGQPMPIASITRLGKLKSHVIITPDAISLDGGKSSVPWAQLNTLIIQPAPQSGYHISLDYDVGSEVSIGDLLGVSAEELENFLPWLLYIAPIDVSAITIPETNLRAYYAVVFEKILRPAENGTRVLPAPQAFILDIPTPTQSRQIILAILALAVSPFLICGLATRMQGKLWSLGSGVYSIILGLPMFIRLVPWLDERLRVKRNQKISLLLVALLAPLLYFVFADSFNPLPLSLLPDCYIVELFFMSFIGAAYWGDRVNARRKAKALAESESDDESDYPLLQ